ncbi:MAG: hypothetical protein KDE29_13295, partial [Anaerolineales bacterium]|nr:hypothetical protein [Anaerolineales bacterium]
PTNTPTNTPTSTPTATPTNVPEVLFEDDFNRSDSNTVGNGWLESNPSNTQTAIQSNRLCVTDASDVVNRPLVKHTFTAVSSGLVVWQFDFDWARNRSDDDYLVFMQLGNSGAMSDDNQDSGVAVNLVWQRVNGVQETLSYRPGNNALTTISGSATIMVLLDFDAGTYDVFVDGNLQASAIPLGTSSIDTVRFFTSLLNERRFSGRCFDNLTIETR